MFAPGSLYAPTLPVEVLLFLHFFLAFAAYYGLDVCQFDVTRAFPRHNDWDYAACQNHRELCMHLDEWESGQPGGMWVQVATNTLGTYDSGHMFSDICDEALLTSGKQTQASGLGMTPSWCCAKTWIFSSFRTRPMLVAARW